MTRKLSPSAIRQRRLRARRRNGWTRVISVEVTATDAMSLREAGFLRQGESAQDALPVALGRMVASIRLRVPRVLIGRPVAPQNMLFV